MKYIYLRILLFLAFFSAFRVQAQFYEFLGFDGYNGTIASVPQYTFISWNSVSPASFYTSAGNFGTTAPSYKFGNDGDYIISKEIFAMDSISFWVKGNGTPFSVLNELRIYYSDDSTNWVLMYTLDSLPTSGTMYTFPMNQFEGQYKFEYFKAPAGGNLAFDDFIMYSHGVIGQPEISSIENINVYPSPTNGILNLQITEHIISQVELYDIIGNKINYGVMSMNGKAIYTINLSNQKKGIYILKIQYGSEVVTRRITLID